MFHVNAAAQKWANIATPKQTPAPEDPSVPVDLWRRAIVFLESCRANSDANATPDLVQIPIKFCPTANSG